MGDEDDMRDSCCGTLHTDCPRSGDCPRCVEAHIITNEACDRIAVSRVALDAARKARATYGSPSQHAGQKRSFATFHSKTKTAADKKAARVARAAKGASHCGRGHAFTPENTRLGVRNSRTCRTCVRDAAAGKAIEIQKGAA